jgi:hypothetical protein
LIFIIIREIYEGVENSFFIIVFKRIRRIRESGVMERHLGSYRNSCIKAIVFKFTVRASGSIEIDSGKC